MFSKEAKILIIGGGFAGARVTQDLAKAGFNHVTLVDKKAYFEVTYATLRSLAQPDLGKRSRLPYEDFINGTFHQGDVTTLTHNAALLADGSKLVFDMAVIASGSSYSTFPIAKSQNAMQLAQRETELTHARQQLNDVKTILIVGGGIVGVELAGEIADHFPEKTVTLVHGSDRLLPELKPKASQLADKQLSALGVKIRYNTRLSPNDDLYQNADLVYHCVGVTPNTSMMKAHFNDQLDQNGRIKVDAQFRVEGTQHLFALGDCANIPEGKLGYLADKQASALAKNMIALASQKTPKHYKANPMVSLVPVGRHQGFVQLPFAVTTLKLMVNMKQKDMFIQKEWKNLNAN